MKKGFKSNANSPQCISFKCKKIKCDELITEEEVIPFKIKLSKPEQGKYKNMEGDRSAININIVLVSLTLK